MPAPIRSTALAAVFLRLALAAGFLSAVADRLGLWGPPGTPGVAWGGFGPFLAYTGRPVPRNNVTGTVSVVVRRLRITHKIAR